jgi:HSP20 family molecular chaperone IbpA
MPTTTQATPSRPDRPVLAPRVDIYESEADLLVTADLPGVPSDGVKLLLDRDELVLEASTRLPENAGETVAREFADVDYRRVFHLPKGIDVDGISARLEHGVLRVRLPRSAEAQPRRIEVRGA